jgi:hypothetical protein
MSDLVLTPQAQRATSVALGVWSVMLMVLVNSCQPEPDCSPCEEALKQTEQLYHQCEAELLEAKQDRCIEVIKAEQKNCQDTINTYKAIRCRICELTNDALPPKPAPSPLTSEQPNRAD